MIFPESHLRWKLSDYVMRFVAEQGVKHVFLVVGGGAMHLNKSLADEKRLVPVCNLHEQASAVAAENYSKATNDLGVCLVTTGPGSTNAITGVAGARLGCTMPHLYSVLGLATDWTTRIDAQLTRLSATQLLRGPAKMAKQAIIQRE
jgi:glyoxylate carboligase